MHTYPRWTIVCTAQEVFAVFTSRTNTTRFHELCTLDLINVSTPGVLIRVCGTDVRNRIRVVTHYHITEDDVRFALSFFDTISLQKKPSVLDCES